MTTIEIPPVQDSYPFLSMMANDALTEAIRRQKAFATTMRFVKYQTDPVLFCEEILGVEPTDDCKRVLESVRDNRVTIVESANGVGKTHTGACAAIWWHRCFPYSKVYLAAAPPIDNLDGLLMGEVHNFVTRKRKLFDNMVIKKRFIGFIKRKWWIWGVAIPTSGTVENRKSKFSGKHAAHLLFIFDEADAIPDEVFEGADGCMSSDHSHMLIMFNPRAQVGAVYRKIRDHQGKVLTISAFTHPNVLTGENKIPGAVSRNITLERFNKWTRPLMEGEPFHDNDTVDVPEFLVDKTCPKEDGTLYPPLPAGKRKIIEPEFCTKVLGVYPFAGETQLIQEDWINRARARWDLYVAEHGEVPPIGVNPRMGQDVAELGGDWNVCYLRYGGWVAPPKFWNGVDVDVTSTRAVEIYESVKPEICIVDATALGSSVAPSMARKGRDKELTIHVLGVKASQSPTPGSKTDLGEFQYIRDQLWWLVREWLKNDPGAMLPPDELLLEELRAPTYHVKTTNGKLVITDKDVLRKQLLRSPDHADALCLTFYPVQKVKVMSVVD